MNFQQIILTLEQYWSEYGCLIQQPCDIEVGAGTFNPATSLRTLGPEPWNVAYVEPSRRPADGRYGDNPYRLGAYYQYQVILKPAPANSQRLYLESLSMLGIDPRHNDIRFVEDDWESPTLGASGLGWEIWCNGAEITQYTYFQQIGSVDLSPISVELTYGLERIALYLQNVDSVFDIQWNDRLKYGDVHHRSEVEYSTYHFQVANATMLFSLFDTYEAEALACLERQLTLPALDYVLKCSHAFNMLDARGAISVTERVRFIERVRNLARRCARTYCQQREEMGHPLLDAQDPTTASDKPIVVSTPSGALGDTADLLFEIGTEEIPASYIEPALNQLEQGAEKLFQEQRLEFKQIQTLGTPRRLTLSVTSLATSQPDRQSLVTGPPKARAYDEDGKPTKAAIGFAKGQGVDVSDLRVVTNEKGEYVAVEKLEAGRTTMAILQEILPELITSLKFPKTMRWSQLRFARPIRWLTALLGNQTVSFQLDTLESSNVTYGHRFLSSDPIALTSASLSEYKASLENTCVIVDPLQRRESIRQDVQMALAEAHCRTDIDDELLDTVNYLVEYPQLVIGHFDESHLALPAEVLVTSMKKHQRYFPFWKDSESLLNRFITISNGTDEGHTEHVQHGNERVLRARLEDAAFFYREDQKTDLASRLEQLKRVVFHAELGDLHEKSQRVAAVAAWLAKQLGVDNGHAERAALLSKTDLVTQMVIEFPSLQGTMGKYYAQHSGEPEEVAVAIEEHYQPIAADAPLPQTLIGAIVSIADKLDTIVGYFGIGQGPTGSQDPYSLRRQTLGVLRILFRQQIHLPLDQLLNLLQDLYGERTAVDTPARVLDFFKGRLEVYLRDQGYAYDTVQAALATEVTDVLDAQARVQALSDFRRDPLFDEVYPAFNRTIRILRGQEGVRKTVDSGLFRMDAEGALSATLEAINPRLTQAIDARDYLAVLRCLGELHEPINRFFDDVLVMSEEPALRANRLALLNRLAVQLAQIADFSQLVIAGEQA